MDRQVKWGLLGQMASQVRWEILDLVAPVVIEALLDPKDLLETRALQELWALRVQKARMEALDKEEKMAHQDQLDRKAPKENLVRLLLVHRESRVFQDRLARLDHQALLEPRVIKVMPALKEIEVRGDKKEFKAKKDLMARKEKEVSKETRAKLVPMVLMEETVEMV